MRLQILSLSFWIGMALLALAAPVSAVVVMDWVPVGDPGNACDPQSQPAACPGSVAYGYSIARYEVTNAQYAEFLNAVDPSGANALELYDANMSTNGTTGGIDFVPGNAAGSRFVVKTTGGDGNTGFANKPVTFIAFYDAVRFANWLNNGQGNADTETGAYTLVGGTPIPANDTSVTRNTGAAVALPTDSEWYKAAYYDAASTSYFDYPAGTDTPTTCGPPLALANLANCLWPSGGNPVDIGSYPASASPYGTFDQGGNVYEWNDDLVYGFARGLRGGSFATSAALMAASAFDPSTPELILPGLGFRVVSLVSDPAPPVPGLENAYTRILLVACVVAIGGLLSRRRVERA